MLLDLYIGFSRDRVVFASFEEFSTVCCDPQSQRLQCVQRSGSRCLSGIILLFLWSNKCWQFDLWSSAFSKPSMYIWMFLIHILLKPSLKDFEHYIVRMWSECNCRVVYCSIYLQLIFFFSEVSKKIYIFEKYEVTFGTLIRMEIKKQHWESIFCFSDCKHY